MLLNALLAFRQKFPLPTQSQQHSCLELKLIPAA
jgi:hypothetical protein